MKIFVTLLIHFFISLAMVQADVKIQRGQLVFPDKSTTAQANLPVAVDPSRSVLLFSYSPKKEEPQHNLVTGDFSAPGSLLFTRTEGDDPITIQWQTIEFSGNVKVLKGLSAITGPTELAIQAVDTRKAFPILQVRSPSDEYGGTDGITLDIFAPDKIRLAANKYRANDGPIWVHWQIIEYGGAKVQQVKATLDQKSVEVEAPIEKVVMENTMLFNTQSFSDFTSAANIGISQLAPSGDRVIFSRDLAGNSLTSMIGYVVEFIDGSLVSHNSVSFTANVRSQSVDFTGNINRSITWMPTQLGRQGAVTGNALSHKAAGNYWIAHNLDGKQAILTRNETGGRVSAPLQILTFAPPPLILDQPADVAVLSGARAMFTVRAQNAKAYQWYDLTGTPIAGATQNTYSLASALYSEFPQGFYCKITNHTDTVTTRTASLKVELEKPSRPVASPAGPLEFVDSLKVGLRASPSGATLYYTLNGDAPSINSARYTDSISLNRTTTLKAIAIVGSEWSDVFSTTYTRIILPTAAAPTGEVALHLSDSTTRVTLKSGTSAARIHYTLDGSKPSELAARYADPILITAPVTLRAIAFADGHTPSAELSQSFAPLKVPETAGNPGQVHLHGDSTYAVEPGYLLKNNAVGSGSEVAIAQVEPEGLNLPGFSDVTQAFRVTAKEANGILSLKSIRIPPGDKSLYRITEKGAIQAVSHADSGTIDQGAVYFFGRDIQPPQITFEKEGFIAGDSTEVIVRIVDNIENVKLELRRSDKPNVITDVARDEQGRIRLIVKPSGPEVRGIGLSVKAMDGRNTRVFPAEGEDYLPSQRFSAGKSPSVLSLGNTQSAPWDLVGFPLRFQQGYSLAKLRDRSGFSELMALTWDEKQKKYTRVESNRNLTPGMALWMATPEKHSALHLEASENQQCPEFTAEIRVSPGWNMVANPCLQKKYWPASPSDPDAFFSSPLKGLNGYKAGDSPGYFKTDSLEPWRGYFVYYYGSRDTVVKLLSQPVAPKAIAKSGEGVTAPAVSIDVFMAFRGNGGRTLWLGAMPGADSPTSWEDEPALPNFQGGWEAFAVRGGKAWSTDIQRFREDSVLQWRVTTSKRSQGQPGETLPISELRYPRGYEVWAISSLRGLKFKLETNGVLPAFQAGDTLDIFAGPASALERLGAWRQAAWEAPTFNYQASTESGAWRVVLHLPSPARVKLSLWTALGEKLEEQALGFLAEGRYDFRFSLGKSSSQTPFPAFRGKLFSLLEIDGGAGSKLPRRKVIPLQP